MSSKRKTGVRAALDRLIVCLFLLGGGLVAMLVLAGLRPAPAEIKVVEPALPVKVIEAAGEDVQVWITGHGRARSLNAVFLSPEVSGRVVRVHPRLEPGEVIARGEILFEVDDRSFKARKDQAGAAMARQESLVERLTLELEHSRRRLDDLERNMSLAERDLRRYQTLAASHNAVPAARVDQAEQNYNLARDQVRQLVQMISSYPLLIREARNQSACLKADYDLACLDLENCLVKNPFTSRLKTVNIEAGQFVAAGQPVLTLADDSVLEIQVRLDCRDASLWLRFNGQNNRANNAWFNRLAKCDCLVRWVEDPEKHVFDGSLDRVVAYDASTRTVTAAVTVAAEQALSGGPAAMPLVEGMFCRVEIPGRTINGAYRIPASAVTASGSVYLARQGRLETRPVTAAKFQGNEALITAGLNPGDLIITTRLVNPLENSKLIVEAKE